MSVRPKNETFLGPRDGKIIEATSRINYIPKRLHIPNFEVVWVYVINAQERGALY